MLHAGPLGSPPCTRAHASHARAEKQVPVSELYAILDHYFNNDQWMSTKQEGWTEGGVMPSIARGMLLTAEGQAGRWIAHGLVTGQLARGAWVETPGGTQSKTDSQRETEATRNQTPVTG